MSWGSERDNNNYIHDVEKIVRLYLKKIYKTLTHVILKYSQKVTLVPHEDASLEKKKKKKKKKGIDLTLLRPLDVLVRPRPRSRLGTFV